jgi:hypothetical protein
MNFLAGLLLLAVDKDCKKTFWLLVVLLEQVQLALSFQIPI